jgi:hypothetical protein
MERAAVTLTATPRFQLLVASMNTYKKGQHKKSVIRIVRRKAYEGQFDDQFGQVSQGKVEFGNGLREVVLQLPAPQSQLCRWVCA